MVSPDRSVSCAYCGSPVQSPMGSARPTPGQPSYPEYCDECLDDVDALTGGP